MTHGAVRAGAPQASPATGDAGSRSRGAAVAGVVGELMITVGTVLALFVVYSLWWTNVVADRQADAAGHRVRQQWARHPAPPGKAPLPPAKPFRPGDGIGFLHVPALGRHYSVLVAMGTGLGVLNEAMAGVYQHPYRAAMPWAKQGNFAMAAHRDGHGAKFHYLDRLKKGDTIVFEARNAWYVYTVDSTLPQISKYDTGVVAPVPKGSGYHRPGRYITLTTCTPVYTSRYRMAVFGHLVRVQPMDRQRTEPAELRRPA